MTTVLTALRFVVVRHHVAPLGFSIQDPSQVPSQESRGLLVGSKSTTSLAYQIASES